MTDETDCPACKDGLCAYDKHQCAADGKLVKEDGATMYRCRTANRFLEEIMLERMEV